MHNVNSLTSPFVEVSDDPDICEATVDDYSQICRLEGANGLGSATAEDWRHFWLSNPLWPELRDACPMGWLMHNGHGRLVGSLMTVPSAYHFRGQRLICANGRGWAVEPGYRGYSLWLMDEFFNQPRADVFVTTTVGASAEQAWTSFGQRVPVGDWCGVSYWITNPANFLHLATGSRGFFAPQMAAAVGAPIMGLADFCRRKLPKAPPDVTIESACTFDERFDDFWLQLIQQNPHKFLGVRDRATLLWHFNASMKRSGLWIFTAVRNGLLRGYLIVKRQQQSNGMRRMRVVDFQQLNEPDYLLPGLLRAALDRCKMEMIDLLENVGTGVPKMQAFDEYAPHRRAMETWPFYFRASDERLHETLRNHWPWDPSFYDGDASFE